MTLPVMQSSCQGLTIFWMSEWKCWFTLFDNVTILNIIKNNYSGKQNAKTFMFQWSNSDSVYGCEERHFRTGRWIGGGINANECGPHSMWLTQYRSKWVESSADSDEINVLDWRNTQSFQTVKCDCSLWSTLYGSRFIFPCCCNTFQVKYRSSKNELRRYSNVETAVD